MSLNLGVNVRVSVSAHFLRKTRANVVFDELPDTAFVFYGTDIKGRCLSEDAEPSDEDEEEIPVCDEVWDTREVHTDALLISGNNYRSIEAIEVVVPSISTHAHSVNNRWHVDKKAYWWMGNNHLRLNINFGEFMEYGLLVSVLQYHVFEVHCGNWLALNPFYQIGMYLQKSNEVLTRALEPG
ncbi:hypothetical protein INT47_005003 [Mucor saturninus]|uniref:Uncharacterized protein n=1 Tax=Mucor saturninus TaxID=64648 RepID=A0A8H7UPR2_9FUNG|nr:hypothetical protein INT47_005003 [Mucor saturninus]